MHTSKQREDYIMWTVEQIVDEKVSIISCGTIEECLKAANRECITVYEARRGDGTVLTSDYRYEPKMITFRFWENGVNVGASHLKRFRDYSDRYFITPDNGQEFKTAITEENVNENYFKLI